MGRDKAMLPYRGRPLIAHVAETVEKVLYGSGHAAIVGQPDRYRDLGYRVLDRPAATRARSISAQGSWGETEPRCAVYHRDSLPVLMGALRAKRLKLREALPELELELASLATESLANLNTPEEWIGFEEQPG